MHDILFGYWNIREHLLSFFRIGIRSEYPNDVLERSIKGNSVAISSPRLVIPGTAYGSWVLSHQYFANDLFDFQIAIKIIFCVVCNCLYKLSNWPWSPQTTSICLLICWLVPDLRRLFQPWLPCLCIRLLLLFKFAETTKTCNLFFRKTRVFHVTEIIHISDLLEYFTLILKYFEAQKALQRIVQFPEWLKSKVDWLNVNFRDL